MLKCILILVPVLLLLSACNMVNTYILKATASPEIGVSETRIQTTTGSVYLSMQDATPQQRELLNSLRPYECLRVTSTEPFKMVNSVGRFNHFKLYKLLSSDSKCQKVKSRKGFSISVGR